MNLVRKAAATTRVMVRSLFRLAPAVAETFLPIALVLSAVSLAGAQSRPATPQFDEGDPALVRILVWQLESGYTSDAERILRANLPQMKERLQDVIKEIDREFDIVGRFGAVSIKFGPGYGALEAKDRGYDKLFELYKKVGGDENLYRQFEARKFRVAGAHFTNEGENLCGDKGDWDGAEKLYTQALDQLNSAFALAQQVNDLRLMSSSKINMGSALIRLGRPQEALAAYNEGLEYADRAPGDLYKGLVRLDIGNSYVWVGDAEKSIPYSQQALTIFRKIGRGTWEANALMNLGNAYLREGLYDKAWETLNQAVQVAQQAGENRVYGRALINLGMTGLQMKKPEGVALVERGLEWYKNDTEIYPLIERQIIRQDAVRMLSQYAQQAGDQSLAEKYIKQYYEELSPADAARLNTLRSSPCFAIYQARPKSASRAAAVPAP